MENWSQSMLDSWGSDDPQAVQELDRYVQETGEGWRVVPMHPREFGVTDGDDIRWLEKMDTPIPIKHFKIRRNMIWRASIPFRKRSLSVSGISNRPPNPRRGRRANASARLHHVMPSCDRAERID